MKVFISWSGDISKKFADILYKYLPCMIQGLEVFTSQHDIESGERWSLKLSSELDASNFGIICLSTDNLNSPWILFEAGALTKHITGRVCAVLLKGLSPTDIKGPLSQFQHRSFNEEDIKKLVEDMNSRLEKPLTETQVSIVFDKWWPDIKNEYMALSSIPVSTTKHQREQRDILEEILSKVRDIEKTLVPKNIQPSDDEIKSDIFGDSIQQVRAALDAGVSVNEKHPSYGITRPWRHPTPLHLAALEGNEDICRLLMESGADLSLTDDSETKEFKNQKELKIKEDPEAAQYFDDNLGATILDWAKKGNHSAVIKLIESAMPNKAN